MYAMTFFTVLLVTAPLLAQEKTAVINIQRAVISCDEGLIAAERLRADSKRALASLEERDAAVKADRAALDRDSRSPRGIWPFRHAMSEKTKTRRSREIDLRAAAVRRERERDRDALEKERSKIVRQISDRMVPIAQTYAQENGYALILDNAQQSSAGTAKNDITEEVIRVYNQSYPGKP